VIEQPFQRPSILDSILPGLPEFHEDLMRKIGLIAVLVGVLIGSFFLTSWLINTGTSPKTTDHRSDAELLASRSISSRSDLIEAAVAVGLHSSTAMKGNVDSVSRLNDRDVTFKGWLADPGGDATPLTLLIFVAGKNAAVIQTHGERPDVTKELGLGSGTEQNVAFEVSFVCPRGDYPILVGLGQDKQYFYLTSPQCP
jgi:hypothetical protein